MNPNLKDAGVATLVALGGVALITVDSPPVNALSYAVRRSLSDRLAEAEADPSIGAVVITCAGRTFFAGADITEFGKPMVSPDLRELIDQIDAMSCPVVAAIHGTALGGGLELALGCHYRVAVPSAKVGLPEIALGLIPGAGGTQRLPRIVGVETALDLITSGRSIPAREAADLGIVDEIIEDGPLIEGALACAQRAMAQTTPLDRLRDRPVPNAPPEVFDRFRDRHARAFRNLPAPAGALEAVQAASTLSFDEGMQVERRIIHALFETSQSRALRHLFFAERAAARGPDLAKSGLPQISRVGVVGAGTMGGGIAMALVNAGIPVTLVDIDQAGLDRGIGAVRRNYEASARKGRLTTEQVESRMAAIQPTTSLEALGDADLVIEAVFESMTLKQELFTRLDSIVRDNAILASNTSFLDLNLIAGVTKTPERVVGLHFFSPANVMKLLEVVRGAKTSNPTLAAATALARRIGKTAVISGVCDGFIANRAMKARSDQADALILAGVAPERIDALMVDYGFAMGPFAMMDLVGLDVVGRDAQRSVMSDLVAIGRRGQKQGGGYYDYNDKRQASPSLIARRIVEAFAIEQCVEPQTLDDDALVARLLYPVVNEGARILGEGIALRASDIDVALVAGYGWPASTGGPMFWADEVGLARILSALDAMADRHGEALRPAPLLREIASAGGQLGAYRSKADD